MPPQTAPHTVIVWFQPHDLRLADHPAWSLACERFAQVLPVYCHAPQHEDNWEGDWPMGAARRWFLHGALSDLDAQLRAQNSALTLLSGDPAFLLPSLARAMGASAVLCLARCEPAARALHTRLQSALAQEGIGWQCLPEARLVSPDAMRNRAGKPYQVFTPFWKACLPDIMAMPALLPAPTRVPPAPSVPFPADVPVQPLQALSLRPAIPWDKGFYALWEPSRASAERTLHTFIAQGLQEYPVQRDRPDLAGVSRLAPYLSTGLLSAREIATAIQHATQAMPSLAPAAQTFLRQLGWREFAASLLWHFPHTPDRPLRSEFERFPWREDPQGLAAWQTGQTGYPLVDAGMRQLWHTGWMHNRVRMVVASFLVKDLRLAWQHGARWFWDTLLDADLANNTLGWQWCAGCGADAAPYFRIFNPVSQSERYDPQGRYLRQWLPELAALPDRALHAPWLAEPAMLHTAGVVLGQTYPAPIVAHSAARLQALAAFKQLRQASAPE